VTIVGNDNLIAQIIEMKYNEVSYVLLVLNEQNPARIHRLDLFITGIRRVDRKPHANITGVPAIRP
jgi:hypothetical protein